MTRKALYREWRPRRFSDVVGQEHVVRTLRNAVQSGTFAHAYLFSGPRGTGKTSLAKILAKAVNCERPEGGDPCDGCAACRGIAEGRIMDVVEMDAASNRGIEEARNLLDRVQYAPTEVGRKVYIIDEVHMLTPEAFNALLKTLEEPPAHCLFILATTEAQRVPGTILSRCQRFDFRRLTADQIAKRLRDVAAAEGAEPEEAALWLIARLASGGMRDAISLLDQVIAFDGPRFGIEAVAEFSGGVTSEEVGHLVGFAIRGERGELLRHLGDLWRRGTDPGQLVLELLSYGRDAILYRQGVSGSDAEVRAEYDPAFRVAVQRFEPRALFRMVEQWARLHAELRFQAQPTLFVEIGLLASAGLTEQRPPETASGAPAGGPREADAPWPGERVEIRLRAEISSLAEQVRRLQQRLDHLERARLTPSAEAAGVVKSAGMASAAKAGKATEASRGGEAGTRASAGNAEELRDPRERADRPVGPEDSPSGLLEQWQAVLDELKVLSIQTRAWLASGRPVRLAGREAVVFFRHSLHAATVMRPQHRELVERVLRSRLRIPDITLRAVTGPEWDSGGADDTREGDGGAVGGEREPWVQKVVELLGEDRVAIVDD